MEHVIFILKIDLPLSCSRGISEMLTVPAFVEPESSSLCSQEPTTGLYPKPDEFNLHQNTYYFIKLHLNISLSSTN
jgi:hypothetical protein